MRIKITVAIAIALAAVALKSLDSTSRQPAGADPHAGALPDATWPQAQPHANSP